ncbi:hypothetical protein J6TS7_54730 [Paenibacillus dendritiformis]|nr:hypothetical protein J6TS7_54730 [Paenibacillus dendritiformis]
MLPSSVRLPMLAIVKYFPLVVRALSTKVAFPGLSISPLKTKDCICMGDELKSHIAVAY